MNTGNLVGRLAVVALLASGVGCELIAGVDRNDIPPVGTGGETSSSSSSSSSGTGGDGGQVQGPGGSGGSGGATGGQGGTGGAMCVVPSDCGSNECLTYACEAGVCSETPKADGTPTAAQTTGDCRVNQCDGAGNLEEVAQDSDLPIDTNDCTDDVCSNGTASNPPKQANTMCGVNLTLLCDGLGNCVGCLDADDCVGQDTECQQRSCMGGVCGVMNSPPGTLLAAQTTGDCQIAQCDGAGGEESADDNSDLPVDGAECTSDLCSDGVPSNPGVPSGTTCSEGTGTLCDGSGACVECLGAADCPGVDDECQTRTCMLGVCGLAFTAAGTPVSTQTAGDCKQQQCDGAGATVVVNLDTDVPVDSNTCTDDVCTAGTPSNPPVANGTSCGAGLTCLAGSCTGCAGPSDCPGVDDECKTRTCSLGACGFAFTPPGTPVAMQTPGNCQQNVCDGAGNVQSVPQNTDLPVDGNQCTSDVCTNGSPSNPLLPTNTTCNQNGGSFCSATGQCVACNLATQCPGSDTDCQSRSCTNNTCGFTFAPAGTQTSMQTPGDCKVNQCDGAGNVVVANANGDVPPDDGLQCTGEVCNAGTPQHPPLAINTACNQSGGSFCDGAGACVACNLPAQCPGSDTDCQTRTCNAHACGFSFAASGTPTSTQTPGDCKENQCNGSGGTMVANNDLDVPPDDGIQCTNEACSAGTPQHPPKPINVACNQSGGSFCDGAGNCVQCNQGSQCASMVCNTVTHTCSAPTCSDGVENGSETDVDCGGSCPDCGPGQGCAVHGDCSGGACNPGTLTCAPTCTAAEALGATCTSYCACMTSTCPGKFVDTAACINACAAFVEPQLCCRAYHCGAAMGDPITHCPHAAGENTCP